MQLIKFSRASVPFPSRLKEYGYDEEEVLKGLKKLQVNSGESATSLKRLLKEKTRIEGEIKETMDEYYSATIKDDLPPKEIDTGIPYEVILTSMCLVRECWTGLQRIAIAAFGHNNMYFIKGGKAIICELSFSTMTLCANADKEVLGLLKTLK
ncbi:hypothetical protein Tco_0567526 [Tanacetum coccineum]